MPLVTCLPKKAIELHHNSINTLEEKCKSCDFFKDKESPNIFTYTVSDEFVTDCGPAIFAIAVFDEKDCALYAPDYVTEEQFVILEPILKGFDCNNKFVVFSQRAYDAIKKYCYDKPINIILC